MRHPLFARFLLIFALLFAQTGGLVHGISHAMADQGQDQSTPHDKLCDLCAAYAQLGTALGSHAISFSLAEPSSALLVTRFHALLSAHTFSAYSSRAPPCPA
ncbi:MAG: hypothetical protein PHP85_04570 [Gallionella sp.]|nr:hypothetical protein [Gallionella sp.]